LRPLKCIYAGSCRFTAEARGSSSQPQYHFFGSAFLGVSSFVTKGQQRLCNLPPALTEVYPVTQLSQLVGKDYGGRCLVCWGRDVSRCGTLSEKVSLLSQDPRPKLVSDKVLSGQAPAKCDRQQSDSGNPSDGPSCRSQNPTQGLNSIPLYFCLLKN
jgi:hypothetical protein